MTDQIDAYFQQRGGALDDQSVQIPTSILPLQ